MIPLVLMAGFLGAGKTRFLTDVIPLLHERGVRVRVVLNDFENAEIDASRLASLDALVTPLNGECVCCVSLRDLMDTLYAVPADPNTVMLIEANGATETDELLGFLTMDSKLSQYTPPLQVTVLDAARWQKRWFHNALERAQSTTATHLFLNWTDKLTPDRLSKVEASVREVNPRATFTTPTQFADEMAELVRSVSDVSDRRALQAGVVEARRGGEPGAPASGNTEGDTGAQSAMHLADRVHPGSDSHSHTNSHTNSHTHAHTHPFASTSMALPAVVVRESFAQFVRMLPSEVVRAKGQVRFSDRVDKMYVWNKVEGRKGVQLDECTPHAHSRPVALFVGVRLPLDQLAAQIASVETA